jgi:hypothetical protein
MDVYRVRVWVLAIEEHNTAEDTGLGPVAYAIGYAFGVLAVVPVPWVAKEGSGKGGWVKGQNILRGAPRAESILLVTVCVLLVKPDRHLVDGSGNKLDEPGGKAGRVQRGSLIVDKKLGVMLDK